MSNPLDQILFDGKSSSDVFKEIYTNSKKKDKQINALIAELKPLIQNIGDAPVVVPLIKEYLEVSVKNDEHLLLNRYQKDFPSHNKLHLKKDTKS